MRVRVVRIIRFLSIASAVLSVSVMAFSFAGLARGRPHAARLTTLINFCELSGCVDGARPEGRLLLDKDGDLFGEVSLLSHPEMSRVCCSLSLPPSLDHSVP